MNSNEIEKTEGFANANIAPILLPALVRLGFVQPTEVQSKSIPFILAGSDLITTAQTGSGKTLAYALGVVTRLIAKPAARALILTPSRETAEQIHKVMVSLCEGLPISVALAAIGSPLAQQASTLRKQPRIVVATPGRMNDHLKSNKLLLQGLEILVIDEADRMLELGFEEQIKFILGTLRGDRQTLLFAAKYGEWAAKVEKLAMKAEAVKLGCTSAGKPVATLKQRVFFLSAAQKERRLLDELARMKGSVMIFADSQESCVSLGRLLDHHGFESDFVHGNMNPGHRNRVLREFMNNETQILVTTDLLARGLDVPSINHVVSYDLPYRGEEFLHRIGRTARAGREGHALTFVTPADGRTFRRMKQYLAGATEEVLASDFSFVE